MSNESSDIIYQCPVPGLSLYQDWWESKNTRELLQHINEEVRQLVDEPFRYQESGSGQRSFLSRELREISTTIENVRVELECLSDHAYVPDRLKDLSRSLMKAWDNRIPDAVLDKHAGPFLYYWRCLFILCHTKTTLEDTHQSFHPKKCIQTLNFLSDVRLAIEAVLDVGHMHPGWSRWALLASAYNVPRTARQTVMDPAGRLISTPMSLNSPLIEKTLAFIEGMMRYFDRTFDTVMPTQIWKISQVLLSEQSALISSAKIRGKQRLEQVNDSPLRGDDIPQAIARTATVKSHNALSLLMKALCASREYEAELLNLPEYKANLAWSEYVGVWVNRFEEGIPNLGFQSDTDAVD